MARGEGGGMTEHRPTVQTDWIDRASVVVQTVSYTHSHVWENESPDFWHRRLLEEVAEVGSVLDGRHEDSLEWELTQIASIAICWMARLKRVPNPEDIYKRHMEKWEEVAKAKGEA